MLPSTERLLLGPGPSPVSRVSCARWRSLTEFDIEIGAGLGPLAGRIWRVGLMGSGSTPANIARFLTALAAVLDR